MEPSTTSLPSQLTPVNDISESKSDVDVILIPAIFAAQENTTWGICSPSVLNSWERSGYSPRLLAFSHGLRLDETFSYQAILDQGTALLNALHSIRKDAALSPARPLVIICHSLGGTILKQTLCVANSCGDSRYAFLLNTIYGIIFLGTPHDAGSLDDFGYVTEGIMQCSPTVFLSKQARLALQQDLARLANLARRFEDAYFRGDILTVYETLPTKTKRRASWLKSKRVLVVSQQVAETHAQHEKCVPLETDHFDLCRMGINSGIDPKIEDWLQSVISHARTNIVDRMRNFNLTSHSPTASFTSSFRAIKQIWNSEALSRSATGGAIDGSSASGPDVEGLLVSLRPERKNAKLPCFMVGSHARNPDFCGREDVLELLATNLMPSQSALISSEPDHMKCVVLGGMGGLGKTEIALEFAFANRDRFDAVFWIRADDPQKLEADFAHIPTVLGLEDEKEEASQPVVNRELAKGWLSDPRRLLDAEHDTIGQAEASWLIIFDNADDPEVLRDYARIFGTGSILVTTRHPSAAELFSGNTLDIKLDPLTDKEGGLMLERLARKSNGPLSQQISSQLGGLPLAIAQMAGIVRRQFLTLDELSERYNDESDRQEMFDMRVEPRSRTARGSIASVWALERLGNPSRSLLEATIFLDPDTIPEGMMRDICGKLTYGRSFPPSKPSFFAARAELIESSLIKQSGDSRDWRIHRILQETVRKQLKGQDLVELFSNAVSMVAAAWPSAALDKQHNVHRWSSCQGLYPHIIWLQDSFQKSLVLQSTPLKFEFATLLAEAAWFQHEMGNFSKVKPLLHLAEDLSKTCDSPRRQDLLCAIHECFQAVATETNDPSACMTHALAFLSIRQDIARSTGKENVELGYAYNETGIAHLMCNKVPEAIDDFHRSIAVYESHTELANRVLPLPLVNLGLAHWLQGSLELAASTLERGLSILDTEPEIKSFRNGRMLHALGNVRYSQGLVDESSKLYSQALASHLATIGPKHHRTADVCFKMAQDRMRRQEFMESRQFIDQAMAIWKIEPLLYKNELARAYFWMSRLLFQVDNESSDAATMLAKAADMRNEVFGHSNKARRDLNEEDFDSIVTFWSR